MENAIIMDRVERLLGKLLLANVQLEVGLEVKNAEIQSLTSKLNELSPQTEEVTEELVN